MSSNRSFKSYVFDRFYNEFYDAVEIFITDNKDDLHITSQHVRRVDESNLDDIQIKHVYINDLPEMEIAFDVLIETVFEIRETDRRRDRFDEVSNWFKIS